MERKVVKQHRKGVNLPGKTNWARVVSLSDNPRIDQDSPELVNKRRFKRAPKT